MLWTERSGQVHTGSQAVDMASALCALELVSISWQEAYSCSRCLFGVEGGQQVPRASQNALEQIGERECGRRGGASLAGLKTRPREMTQEVQVRVAAEEAVERKVQESAAK